MCEYMRVYACAHEWTCVFPFIHNVPGLKLLWPTQNTEKICKLKTLPHSLLAITCGKWYFLVSIYNNYFQLCFLYRLVEEDFWFASSRNPDLHWLKLKTTATTTTTNQRWFPQVNDKSSFQAWLPTAHWTLPLLQWVFSWWPGGTRWLPPLHQHLGCLCDPTLESFFFFLISDWLTFQSLIVAKAFIH